MDEFSSLREFGQMSEQNDLIEEEKHGFRNQSLPGEPAEVEVQNDAFGKENQVIESCSNDLGSVGSLINKDVHIGNVISDVVSLNKGVNVGLRFEDGVENQEKSSHASERCQEVGLNEDADVKVSLGGVNVSLEFDPISVQINEVISDILSERVDVSSNFENGSKNQGEGGHESGMCDIVGLNENDDLKVVVSEGVDVSLKFEHMSEDQGEGATVGMGCEQPGLKEDADLNNAKLEEESKDDEADSSRMKGAHISMVEQVENLQSDMLKSGCKLVGYECEVNDLQANLVEQFTPPPAMQDEKRRIVVLALTPDRCEKARHVSKAKVMPMKMESPVVGARALRSRSKENREDREPSADLESRNCSTGRRRRKKGKEKDGKSNDEFAKMKKHLQYLLHRIKYEQNLLDAYSNEGWRGQSIEKLRPEKELQRAKADINRSKLKIRDLFQQIENMSAEGKYPESLYDSDGLIDSEDIYCAKCGSKDVSTGNDILLCDGICDRGFHQKCLNPPLPTEEIPPGDEGWLCPACDCKVDCYDLLNDSHGTKLTIEDSWEKVFPEAVATTAGNELDDIMGLPSDDSEDNEYDPDAADENIIAEGNESSSDESDSSDFSSASEDLGAICVAGQTVGLPSDDSEDDDFDPDAANVKEDGDEAESSGSDFTSASEDLGAAIGDEGTSDQGGPPLPLVSEQDLGESAPVTGKRCVERLDYKKLYDETYGNAASDSSDDEEWTDKVPTRKRKISAEIGSSGSGRRKGLPKANSQAANWSPAQLQGSSEKTNSASGGKRRPPNRLGEAVTKRLYESFKENQYPDRETKEKLANEIGLTFHQVDKWFGHARWSLHHHPSRIEAVMNRILSSNNTPHSVPCNGVETPVNSDNTALAECGGTDTSRKKLKPRRPSGSKEDNQRKLENSSAENSNVDTQVDRLQTPESTPGRVLRKRRKSGA